MSPVPEDSETEIEVDARRLLCPLPVIRTQDRIRSLAPGARVTVRCTDPGALHDIPTWCRIHGHTVVASQQSADEIRIRIEVGG